MTDYSPELMAIGRILERIAVQLEKGSVAHPAVVSKVAWVCPIHRQNKMVPAGVSKKTGRPYNAFIVCGYPGCEERPPQGAASSWEAPAPVQAPLPSPPGEEELP